MGQYREKNCKYCKKLHRKRGAYCSQSCANRDRKPTEKMRRTMSRVAIEYNKTPEAIAQQKLLHTRMKTEDFAVNLPDFPDFSEFPECYERAENW